MAQMRSWRRPTRLVAAGMVLAALLVLAACGSSPTPGAQATHTPSISATAAATTTPGVTGSPINVYFSKTPETDGNFSQAFPVKRVAPLQQVEVFAVQLLVAGPTPDERAAGYYSELNGLFNGPSQCPSRVLGGVGGPDFTLTLNMKGTMPEQGTATLKFCRTTLSGGIGVDARVNGELNATLLQFPTIKKLVILNIQGHCFGDMSGQDLCLK
jgi:hypothetical protein